MILTCQPLQLPVLSQALRLSSCARHGRSVGELVNLVSIDSQKVEEMFVYYNSLWNVPLSVVVCMLFLWREVGLSAFAGLAVLAVLIPINAVFLGSKISQYQVPAPHALYSALQEVASIKPSPMYTVQYYAMRCAGHCILL